MWQTRSHFVYFMILSTFYNRIEFLEDFCIFCLFSSIVSLFIFQLTDTNMSFAVSAGCCYGATISLLVSVVKYWAVVLQWWWWRRVEPTLPLLGLSGLSLWLVLLQSVLVRQYRYQDRALVCWPRRSVELIQEMSYSCSNFNSTMEL